MRRSLQIAVLAALALLVAACGASLEKAVVGKYGMDIDTSKMAEKDKAQVEAAKGLFSGFTMELKEDKTCAVSAMGQDKKGTWKLDGTKLTITVDNKPETFEVEDGGKKLAIGS